jgi:putative oxidoreductase
MHSRPFGPLLLRLALGAMWISHALLKLIVYTLPGTAAFFESKGIPGLLAYPVFTAELIGGVLILAGVYARQVALVLVPILLGALVTHFPNGWVFTAPGGGFEYPLFLVAMSFVLWLSDDGAFALRSSALPTAEEAA